MKNLLRYVSILLVACCALTAAATADTTLYLVRHAEKQSDGTHNPSLTEAGAARALRLAETLAEAGLKRIYSTDYKRTQETAAPTAKRQGLTVTSYDPRALREFAEQLQAQPTPSLIVGHSNTTPVLVNLLVGSNQFPLLEEHQYDHLYVVTLKDDGSASATIHYIEPRTP